MKKGSKTEEEATDSDESEAERRAPPCSWVKKVELPIFEGNDP